MSNDIKQDLIPEPLLTVTEMAKELRFTPATIRRMAANGIIPSLRLGQEYRFRLSDVLRHCQQDTVSKAT